MGTPFSRAPHVGGSSAAQSQAPNAALLIDFDNVTMGMRSDLSKELRNLLNSAIIKGKVAVQRAYADWRRYPQYIVPLSENSVDLIFAPAYGSSKKNATDIRMAIDALELVFVRPEIGTFILLTGDSDFSSVVLKLKEYGKYVIGVGIQESSSDILVQNCDEYYSYTTLTGLRKTTTGSAEAQPVDAWLLVERALERMVSRNDVMRSDRLKQVMLEIDPGFEEKSFGYSKFSRFLAEASSRGLIHLRKLENGQYEVAPARGRAAPAPEAPAPRRGRREEGRGRTAERDEGRARRPSDERARAQEPRREAASPEAPRREALSGEPPGAGAEPRKDPLQEAYGLLRRAVQSLTGNGRGLVRDSDVKRKMLELDGAFDEAELGFGKFSRFLRQAHDHEVVELRKGEAGNYHVGFPGATEAESPQAEAREDATASPAPGSEPRSSPAGEPEGAPGPFQQPVAAGTPATAPSEGAREVQEVAHRLRPRGGSRRRRGVGDEPPPLLEGQTIGAGAEAGRHEASRGRRGPAVRRGGREAPPSQDVDPKALGLPTDAESMVRYLSNSYKGVGQKTAEALVEAFGEELFPVLAGEPERIQQVVPPARAEKLLEGWEADYERRASQAQGPAPDAAAAAPGAEAPSRRRTRRGRGRSAREGGADRGGAGSEGQGPGAG